MTPIFLSKASKVFLSEEKSAVEGFIAAASGISLSFQTRKVWGYFGGANSTFLR